MNTSRPGARGSMRRPRASTSVLETANKGENVLVDLAHLSPADRAQFSSDLAAALPGSRYDQDRA